ETQSCVRALRGRTVSLAAQRRERREHHRRRLIARQPDITNLVGCKLQQGFACMQTKPEQGPTARGGGRREREGGGEAVRGGYRATGWIEGMGGGGGRVARVGGRARAGGRGSSERWKATGGGGGGGGGAGVG
ncbi:hypothetical protein B1218_37455, partial [Pseudomonas ogarae]